MQGKTTEISDRPLKGVTVRCWEGRTSRPFETLASSQKRYRTLFRAEPHGFARAWFSIPRRPRRSMDSRTQRTQQTRSPHWAHEILNQWIRLHGTPTCCINR